ncbi:MAG: ABC transporter ATP-binding protein [Clostridiales Family XIII bacterium]|jgi:peptide/nickel transport system ATP-binding protein|nr:ABC transporter ATP-binding protein [Clostridiales Family XIII bacterium]
MTLLSIRDLCVDYLAQDRTVRAVDRFSLDIPKGESFGIVGESGSGKSTLILALMGLLSKRKALVTGSALLDGADLIAMSEDERRAVRWKKMSIVFQNAMNSFSPVHRIGKMMQDIYFAHCPDSAKAERRTRMEELLGLVGLPPRVCDLYPHELSGGMMQRVNIALSLMFNPELLIMDEATTALDVVTQTQILKEIAQLEEKLDITRVMVTHDISVVASSCENVVVMYAGRCLEVGSVKTVLTKPAHPYTKGLIGGFPAEDEEGSDEEKRPLTSIPGTLPDLGAVPAGCIFEPRCDQSADACKSASVNLASLDDGRKVRCRRYGG